MDRFRRSPKRSCVSQLSLRDQARNGTIRDGGELKLRLSPLFYLCPKEGVGGSSPSEAASYFVVFLGSNLHKSLSRMDYSFRRFCHFR
jgi:hypothetical protein